MSYALWFRFVYTGEWPTPSNLWFHPRGRTFSKASSLRNTLAPSFITMHSHYFFRTWLTCLSQVVSRKGKYRDWDAAWSLHSLGQSSLPLIIGGRRNNTELFFDFLACEIKNWVSNKEICSRYLLPQNFYWIWEKKNSNLNVLISNYPKGRYQEKQKVHGRFQVVLVAQLSITVSAEL